MEIFFGRSVLIALTAFIALYAIFRDNYKTNDEEINNENKVWDFLTNEKSLVFFTIISAALSIFLDWRSTVDANNEKENAKKQYDSLSMHLDTVKIQLDSANKTSFKNKNEIIQTIHTVNKDLVKFSLRYDSAQKQVIPITSHTTIINAAEPYLDFCDDGIEILRKVLDDDISTPDTIFFAINLCGDATAYNIKPKAKLLAIASNDGNYFFEPVLRSTPFNLSVEKSMSLRNSFNLTGNTRLDWIVVWLTGTYSDKQSGGKTFTLNSWLQLKIADGECSVPDNVNELLLPVFRNQKNWKKLYY